MHNFILKLYGLKKLIILPTNNNLPIVSSTSINIILDADNNINQVASQISLPWYYNKIFMEFINFIQFVSVLLIICWPLVFAIVLAGVYQEYRWFSSNIFTLTIILQYIFGYYRYSRDNVRILNKKIIDVVFFCGLIVSIINAVVAIILVIFTEEMNIYTYIYGNIGLEAKIVFLIVVFFTFLLSYGIMISNFIVFSMTFINHAGRIKIYGKTLREFIIGSRDDILIQTIIREYSELKESYMRSVNKMNNLFSSFIIINSIGCYFMSLNWSSNYIYIYNYVNAVFFVLVMSVYIYSIQKVKDNVQDIKNLVNGTTFVNKYLDKMDLETLDIEEDEEGVNALHLNTLGVNPLASSSGSGIGNKPSLKGLVTRIMNTRSIVKSDTFLKTQLKEICTRILINSHENAASLDWIVLYDILQSDWDYFTVMGFALDDQTLIKQSVSVIVMIVMILVFNKQVIMDGGVV